MAVHSAVCQMQLLLGAHTRRPEDFHFNVEANMLTSMFIKQVKAPVPSQWQP